MTQQTQGDAVGGASNTVVAAEPTIIDRFAAVAGQAEEPKKPEDNPDAPPSGDAPPELTADDVPDEAGADDAGDPADELPAIKPPVSWTAEEQEEFKNLPPKLQEAVTRREAEREKFVQSKAQEAKQARAAVEREAVTYVQQLQHGHIQALNSLQVQVPARPSYALQAEDPYAFAEQMDAHERAVTYNQYVAQQVQSARQQVEHVMGTARAIESQQTHELLQQHFPEYLDSTKGPDLRTKLGATATELGYTDEQLANVDGKDILAMRKANEWREDSIKYRKLMAQKMEQVRSAKDLPRVSRPGTSQGRGAAEGQRYQADRQAMRDGDKDAAARVFAKFL
jgi:hypothetical protein